MPLALAQRRAPLGRAFGFLVLVAQLLTSHFQPHQPAQPLHRHVEQREHARSIVEIEAQCLIVAGFSADVAISDISPGECQVRVRQGYLTKGWSVGIQFAGMNILPGTVCWTTENTVGVQFDKTLATSTLRRLLERSRPKAGGEQSA